MLDTWKSTRLEQKLAKKTDKGRVHTSEAFILSRPEEVSSPWRLAIKVITDQKVMMVWMLLKQDEQQGKDAFKNIQYPWVSPSWEVRSSVSSYTGRSLDGELGAWWRYEIIGHGNNNPETENQVHRVQRLTAGQPWLRNQMSWPHLSMVSQYSLSSAQMVTASSLDFQSLCPTYPWGLASYSPSGAYPPSSITSHFLMPFSFLS